MARETVPTLLGDGGAFMNDALPKILRETFKTTLVAGAAANTKMDIAALRLEDTIQAVLVSTDAGGALADDTANVTIQATKASGTITITGNPTADQTVTVNDNVYTWKATPSAANHVKITAGNNNQMATDLANSINNYEMRITNSGRLTPAVVAVAATNVVTVTSVADGAGSGPVITENTTGTTIVVSNTDPGAVTATFASAVNDNALVVNGVTFTLKTTITNADIHMGIKADDTLQAAECARIINAYDLKYGTIDAIATSALGVVTVKSRKGRTGNTITLSDTSSNVACSGSGFLANGTNTGGIKSTTNLSSKSVTVYWWDKNP